MTVDEDIVDTATLVVGKAELIDACSVLVRESTDKIDDGADIVPEIVVGETTVSLVSGRESVLESVDTDDELLEMTSVDEDAIDVDGKKLLVEPERAA